VEVFYGIILVLLVLGGISTLVVLTDMYESRDDEL
jgi:hypothetical protein